MGIRDATIEETIARESLRRLVTAYSRAVDRRDFALLRSLYHDDAFEEHGNMFAGNADDYVAFVRRALSNYEMTDHYVVNMTFEIDGDEAEGEVYKINYHRTSGPDAEEVVTGSRSLDRYRRRQGEWRFLSRSITLDWAQKRPVDRSAYEDFAAGSPPGKAGPDDLSYSLLQLFKRHPG
ncbi:nuclear transport factor 2 family protein [Oricola sp.]|uniref:nuclear transport factor 2 family protein n=1 Tax=Oricola sp. TaxID=1979950 RepID=UPI0025D066A1|nr:nuclear transport factor 2 family protein [Oricola sp.]MCI5074468.1 nuclear transport factor 2 family protein [Oricola sp.]